MQQLLTFIVKRKHFFLFVFIQLITLWITIQNQDYHRAKFINSSGNLTGRIYSISSYWNRYLGLEEENKRLLEENAKLHSLMQSSMFELYSEFKNQTDTIASTRIQKYSYTGASVINNSYALRNNHITIDKGLKHNIKNESGVISSKGIIGIVETTGKNYSSVISVLNNKVKINAKLLNSDYYGSLSWPGEKRNMFLLSDVPKQAEIAVGDTIVTGGYSTIFPEGIKIGRITDFRIPEGQNYYMIDVESFEDYANLKSVYVVQNLHREELTELEKAE